MGRATLRRGRKGRAFSPLGIAVAVVLLLLGSGGRPFAAGQAEGLDIEQVQQYVQVASVDTEDTSIPCVRLVLLKLNSGFLRASVCFHETADPRERRGERFALFLGLQRRVCLYFSPSLSVMFFKCRQRVPCFFGTTWGWCLVSTPTWQMRNRCTTAAIAYASCGLADRLTILQRHSTGAIIVKSINVEASW